MTPQELFETVETGASRFRHVLNQAPAGAAMISLDYHLLAIDELLCRINGYLAKELTSRSL